MSSGLLFAERDSRVQQLQPGPQAVESFQHVLHAGLKIRLNLEESDQGIRPVREGARERLSVPGRSRREPLSSPLLQVAADEPHFVCCGRVSVHIGELQRRGHGLQSGGGRIGSGRRRSSALFT